MFGVNIMNIGQVISDLVSGMIRMELHETHTAGREYYAKTLSSGPALVRCGLEEIETRIYH